MKRPLVATVAALAALLGAPVPISAQGLDVGGFLEWIHRLSGPQFAGPGASVATTGETVRFRLSAAYRWSFDSDEAVDPDGAGITQLSIRPALEIPFADHFAAAGGVGLHRYAGDSDGFWHWSIPLHLQARLEVTDVAALRLGAGAHYFPAFDTDDFLPLVVEAPRDSGEWVPTAYLGVDWRIF